MLAGIELGGTKTIVVGGRPGAIAQRIEFPTAAPAATLERALAGVRELGRVEALGIAAFGPIRVDPTAADFGVVLDTPKPGWSGANLAACLGEALGVPFALDTDVNAAALAEHRFGAARGCADMAYLTIGTGVGGGFLVAGQPVHGTLHPEIGHARLRRARGDAFPGACRFHGDCVEGLLAGPALAARFGRDPAGVAPGDLAWEAPAHDLAQLLVLLLLALSPARIVIGGGVATGQPQLLNAAAARVPEILAGYLGELTPKAVRHIVRPAELGNDAGPTGALILAERAACEANRQDNNCGKP